MQWQLLVSSPSHQVVGSDVVERLLSQNLLEVNAVLHAQVRQKPHGLPRTRQRGPHLNRHVGPQAPEQGKASAFCKLEVRSLHSEDLFTCKGVNRQRRNCQIKNIQRNLQ